MARAAGSSSLDVVGRVHRVGRRGTSSPRHVGRRRPCTLGRFFNPDSVDAACRVPALFPLVRRHAVLRAEERVRLACTRVWERFGRLDRLTVGDNVRVGRAGLGSGSVCDIGDLVIGL